MLIDINRFPLRLLRAVVALVCAGHLAQAQVVDRDWPNMNWDQVLAEANGQTVRLWHWCGDSHWNAYFDEILGGAVKDKGVSIEPVLINDTAETVNKVLAEIEAGQEKAGVVDVIWINGENFV